MKPVHDCVVDASVAIKLFLDEELSDRARNLIGQLGRGSPPRFYVPDHFFIECANVLWKYVSFFDYGREAALEDLMDLRQLPWSWRRPVSFWVSTTRSRLMTPPTWRWRRPSDYRW